MTKLIISVTPEELESQAEKARRIQERYDQILEEMKAMFHAFDGQLKQETIDSCVAYFDSQYKGLTDLSHILNQYGEAMHHGAESLRIALSDVPWPVTESEKFGQAIREMKKLGESGLSESIHD